MFGLFKKKSEIEKLQTEYKKVLEQAFKLSKTDRSASDALYAKADKIAQEIDTLS